MAYNIKYVRNFNLISECQNLSNNRKLFGEYFSNLNLEWINPRGLALHIPLCRTTETFYLVFLYSNLSTKPFAIAHGK